MAPVLVIFFSFMGAAIFGLINFFAYKISRHISKHKSKVLSFFGGVTATYVFLDLLPSLEQSNLYLRQIGNNVELIALYEDAIFLVVLAGFLLFFVLEHIAIKSRQKQLAANQADLNQTQASKRVFLIHLFTVAFPDFVVSFIFIFEFNTGAVAALLFAVAVSMHLFISSETMLEHYKDLYIRVGRYVTALVPLLGWVASVLWPETIAQAYILLAFISGVILYHAIRNELPTNFRRSSITFFLLGAGLYAALLIGHAVVNA
jgi:hypothetical protein